MNLYSTTLSSESYFDCFLKEGPCMKGLETAPCHSSNNKLTCASITAAITKTKSTDKNKNYFILKKNYILSNYNIT